jgi:hypothetical protein
MSLPPHSWDYGRAYCCILPRLFDKSATFFSLRLTFLYGTQARQGLRSPVTNVVRTLRMYGAIPWIESVFVACCLIKYRDFIFFYVTSRGGFCVVSTLFYRLTDSSIIAKKNICTREQPVTCSSVDLSCRSGRQTGGCDYIIWSHLICTSHCGSQSSTGVADRLEGIVCVYSFVVQCDSRNVDRNVQSICLFMYVR